MCHRHWRATVTVQQAGLYLPSWLHLRGWRLRQHLSIASHRKLPWATNMHHPSWAWWRHSNRRLHGATELLRRHTWMCDYTARVPQQMDRTMVTALQIGWCAVRRGCRRPIWVKAQVEDAAYAAVAKI
jgi:hypothetical protein